MRWTQIGALLVGSWLVSLACAASRDGGPSSSKDAGLVDAVADAVRDALGLDTSVSDAWAGDSPAPPAPTPPTVDTVTCNVTTTVGQVFARKDFPGRTATDLARGVAVVCGGPFTTPVDSSACQTATLWVKDGTVYVYCGNTGSMATSVRLVMPPPP